MTGSSASGSKSTSVARSSPARWPPFTRTAPGVVRAMMRAACTMESRPWAAASMPARTLASGMLGVTTCARQNSSSTMARAAPSAMSAAPLVATMTGSTTMLPASWRRRPRATVRATRALESMPILTEAGRMSSNTASIWSATICTSVSCMERTPQVFCAVSAQITLWPYKPRAAMVLRSAWMPAPPDESLPATVRTEGSCMGPPIQEKRPAQNASSTDARPGQAAQGQLPLRRMKSCSQTR